MYRHLMTATESEPEQVTAGVSLPTLTAMVVGSMIGSDVYSRMARKCEDVGRATVIGFLACSAFSYWSASSRTV
jgi:hypothetical protein